jgi:hypothetical protein
MSMKSTLRKLTRAFAAKDEKTFDEAVEELEDKLEDAHDEEDPDTIEVHNHIPDSRDALGEVPPKDPPMPGARDEGEEPEWFKKFSKDCMDRFTKMNDDISGLQKWAKQEGEEPEHQEDAGNLENLGEHALPEKDDDPNLEMDRRRGKDAKDDEPNKAILGELEFEAPPGTGDKARKARDSAYLEESFQDVVSKAEILAPGIRVPTFDRAVAPLKTTGTILALRRTALDLAYSKPETRGLIDQALGGRALDSKKMSHSAARVLFNAVAAAAAQSNNARATDRSTAYEAGGGLRTNTGGKLQTPADINARNAERYGRRKSA